MNPFLKQLKNHPAFVWVTKRIQNKWIRWTSIGVASCLLFGILFYLSIYFGAFGKLPTTEELSSISQEESTQLLDRNEELIGKYFIYDRQPIDYDDFPQHLINALVATEDARFYEHDGVDNMSLLRVFIKNLILQDKSAGGGSTITLQLAKNLFGRKNYWLLSTPINKIKESITAKRIENIYSKEEILTLYLNTVPFSDNTYGIESASQKFFNTSAKDLTVSEAALLVGTLKANTYYNPRLHLDRSIGRRNVVLEQMANYGYLEKDSVSVYKAQEIILDYKPYSHDQGIAPYFREAIKKQLVSILDTLKNPEGGSYNLYKDGLVVHTTLDYKMQQYAETSMKEHLTKLQKAFEASYGNSAPWLKSKDLLKNMLKQLPQYKNLKSQGLSEEEVQDSLKVKRSVELFNWEGDTIQSITVADSLQHYLKFLNAGMLSIDPSSGAIRTYIGGIDYRFFKYDHVSQSERQVGSTFKPIVYAAAIENGMKPCTHFSPSEVTYTNYEDWTPSNSGEDEEDPHINYSLEKALSKSVNTISVKVLDKTGLPSVIEQAKKMGITKDLPNEPSLALGTAELSVADLASAYSSFVNNGVAVKPFGITKIEDKEGNTIAEFEPKIASVKAFSDYTREVLMEFMKTTVNEGTATRLRSTYGLQNAIAGKTGTTQDNKDGWFVALTPNLVTVTWVGNDNHQIGFRTTGQGQGANSALPVFAKFYQKLNRDRAFRDITSANFGRTSETVLEDLDCEAETRDGFFKRLFKKREKEKEFN